MRTTLDPPRTLFGARFEDAFVDIRTLKPVFNRS